MGFLSDFKKFVMKGNILELAVAVIIGAAFGKIVTSFVNDIIMPPIGVALGGVDFSDLMYTLKEATGEEDAVAIRYGSFIQTIIDFLIVALSVFVVLKSYDRLQRKKPIVSGPPPAPTNEEKLLVEIRDILKDKPAV